MDSQPTQVRHGSASIAFAVAAVAGLVHAAASVFWAIGGTWQLASVGQWAVQLSDEHPVGAGLALGGIAVVKAVAAFAPLMNERVKGRFYRPLRWCGVAGGSVLVLWGGLSALAACAVLFGLTVPADGYDRVAMIGHAFVWDPLFALWGAALLAGLWLTRSRRDAVHLAA